MTFSALISPLSIAPMIDWTNTHFRVLMRLLAPHALLYTEMQTTGAVKHKEAQALFFTPMESPLALQLGGADKQALLEAALKAEDKGFAEINLNLGCPSDKVQAGNFGACLMAESKLVAECIDTLKQKVSLPVTAKTRIGIDHQDSYEFFSNFVNQLVVAGCDKVIVHARKAWLKGLSPKQNRSIPPLHYDYVYRLKAEYPALPIVINGNIQTLEAIEEHMKLVDGVMIGRLACQNPYAIASLHHHFFPYSPMKSRSEVIAEYLPYLHQAFQNGTPLSILLKPIFNFAHGLPGAGFWKKQLQIAQQDKNVTALAAAISFLERSSGVLPSNFVEIPVN